MSRLKQHFQRKYRGIRYEACQKHDSTWWGYVPHAVSPQFKVGPLKDGKEALRRCLEYIKASQAKK
ncbi:MAG: hypothetical protein R6W69_01075 [Anaerolineales bacterium]